VTLWPSVTRFPRKPQVANSHRVTDGKSVTERRSFPVTRATSAGPTGQWADDSPHLLAGPPTKGPKAPKPQPRHKGKRQTT
jgi:hypothetical protein